VHGVTLAAIGGGMRRLAVIGGSIVVEEVKYICRFHPPWRAIFPNKIKNLRDFWRRAPTKNFH
jgi:hypothetical protein